MKEELSKDEQKKASDEMKRWYVRTMKKIQKKSIREIAEALGISQKKVREYLDESKNL